MNHPSKAFFSIIFALLWVFTTWIGANAHDDIVRIEISPEQLNPGGVLQLRGVGFEPEVIIQLTLVGTAGVTTVGELSSDQQGEFTQIITIPVDLPEGIYYARAKSDEHEVISPALTIQGAAVIQDQQGSAVLENDSLLAPMPTPEPDYPLVKEKPSVSPDAQPNKTLLVIPGFLAISALAAAVWAAKKHLVNKS